MLPPDPGTPGGRRLFLVDELCETWGVRQDLGATCVWCEIPLDDQPAVGGERAGGKRTYPWARSSVMRSPCLTSVEVLMREPLGGDATACSAIAVADRVPG